MRLIKPVMKKISTYIRASACLVLVLLSLPASSLETGQVAPDFTLPGVRAEDAETTLSALKGKVVYVDFWASWCLPCLRSLPEINGLYEKYRDQGFEVLAVTIDAPVSDAHEFLANLEAPLDYTLLADETSDVMYAYEVRGMPTSFLVDRQGNIHMVHEGFRDGDIEVIDNAIETLLTTSE